MDANLAALLDELHCYGAEHDAGRADRLERLRNVEPDTRGCWRCSSASWVHVTCWRSGPRTGTRRFGWPMRRGASVAGCSASTSTPRAARWRGATYNAQASGPWWSCGSKMRRKPSPASADEAWDMVFLDAERPFYVGYWPDLVRVLRPGGLLAVDNVTSHAEQVRDFRALVSGDERVSEAVVPTGAGLLLVSRNPAPPP